MLPCGNFSNKSGICLVQGPAIFQMWHPEKTTVGQESLGNCDQDLRCTETGREKLQKLEAVQVAGHLGGRLWSGH